MIIMDHSWIPLIIQCPENLAAASNQSCWDGLHWDQSPSTDMNALSVTGTSAWCQSASFVQGVIILHIILAAPSCPILISQVWFFMLSFLSRDLQRLLTTSSSPIFCSQVWFAVQASLSGDPWRLLTASSSPVLVQNFPFRRSVKIAHCFKFPCSCANFLIRRSIRIIHPFWHCKIVLRFWHWTTS